MNKFINLLEDADFHNTRVIITGDHGFRHNKSINPNLTNIYLKGYGKLNKSNLTVQEIGGIVLESFF